MSPLSPFSRIQFFLSCFHSTPSRDSEGIEMSGETSTRYSERLVSMSSSQSLLLLLRVLFPRRDAGATTVFFLSLKKRSRGEDDVF